MSDSSDAEIDEIRERKREQLETTLSVPGEPLHAESRDHLQEVVDTYGVVLIDFHADWCGPCRMLEPTVEAIAADTDAAVIKVDIDAHQDIATEFNVRGVPTLVLFAGGEAVERIVGVRGEDELRGLVEEHA